MAAPNIPVDYADYEHIISSNWREIKDPKTTRELNGFIVKKMRNWKGIDGSLHNDFYDDFKQITVAMWTEVDKDLLKTFMYWLRQRGVLIRISNRTLAQRMYDGAQIEEEDEWSEDKIKK